MNVAMQGRVTAQDVVRVEAVRDDLEVLRERVDALRECLIDLGSMRMSGALKAVEQGARRFAKHDESAAGELRREIALARALLQNERWSGWWRDVERKLADVEAEFAEFRVRRQLGLALECCSE
jgi:hypothetical protein